MTVKINVNRKRIHKEIQAWRKEYKYYTTCLQVSDYFLLFKMSINHVNYNFKDYTL